jgi:hypothetical protein
MPFSKIHPFFMTFIIKPSGLFSHAWLQEATAQALNKYLNS